MERKKSLNEKFLRYYQKGLLTQEEYQLVSGYLRRNDIPGWLTRLSVACSMLEEGKIDAQDFTSVKAQYLSNAEAEPTIVHQEVIETRPVGADDARDEESQAWVRNCALIAALIGLLPLPVADAPFLIILQYVMLKKLCDKYDRRPGMSLVLIIMSATLGPMVFDAFIKFLPLAGSIIGATIAGSFTWYIGAKVRLLLVWGRDFTWDNFWSVKVLR